MNSSCRGAMLLSHTFWEWDSGVRCQSPQSQPFKSAPLVPIWESPAPWPPHLNLWQVFWPLIASTFPHEANSPKSYEGQEEPVMLSGSSLRVMAPLFLNQAGESPVVKIRMVRRACSPTPYHAVSNHILRIPKLFGWLLSFLMPMRWGTEEQEDPLTLSQPAPPQISLIGKDQLLVSISFSSWPPSVPGQRVSAPSWQS